MLRNRRRQLACTRLTFLNEVLSLNAQELLKGLEGPFLNEVLSLNAQEYNPTLPPLPTVIVPQ